MSSRTRKGYCAFIVAVFVAFLAAGLASAFIYFNTLPPISQLQSFQPTLVSQIVSSDNIVIKTFGAYKYKKVTLEEMPDNLKKAIIATEDKNFYSHLGFDPVALVRSSLSNIRAGHVVQGASTITQQLARILFLSTEKTFDRKIKELIIAYRLEKTLPKDKILEMYLNNIYLGEGAYGVSAASEIYFNKNVKTLNLAEAALIAGLPQAPSRYSPYQNMKYAKERRAMVLRRMVTMGYITSDEAAKAKNSSIKLNKNHRPYSLNKAPYFVNYVLKELDAKADLSEQEVTQGGYKVYTTLNYDFQKAAQDAVDINTKRWRLTKPYQQVALLSTDVVTGKILAYIGGKDYLESQFDRVTQSLRQPGSSFKPFVYATAMESGLSPRTIYEDIPLVYGNWKPHNYGHKYRGRISLEKALAISSNVIAARLIRDIGVENVILMARRLGITTAIPNDPTIALGSGAVKLFEITNAYGVFANGGVKVEPYSVERVETATGKVIYQADTTSRKVLNTKTAVYMTAMLQGVIKHGTGRAANIGKPTAGKTGTTDSYRDAWFIGYTPSVVTGVWVGNDNNTPTRGLTGGTVPATIWGQYMRVVEARRQSTGFTYPEIIINQDNTASQKEEEPFEDTSNLISRPTANYGAEEQQELNNNNSINTKIPPVTYDKPQAQQNTTSQSAETLQQQVHQENNAPPVPR